MNQLLILGNGFDLSCNLESTYSNFFKWRKEKLMSNVSAKLLLTRIERHDNLNNDDVRELMAKVDPKLKINDWDILFTLRKLRNKPRWSDIEYAIYTIITNLLVDNNQSSDDDQFTKDVKRYLFNDQVNNDSIKDDLLKSLGQMEEVFSEFILERIKLTTGYPNKAKSLLMNLTNCLDNVDVVSFNYTLSMIDVKDMGLNFNSWTNVHGNYNYKQLNDETDKVRVDDKQYFRPLFSVDGYYDDCDQFISDDRIIFTKTHRLEKTNHSYYEKLSFSNIDVVKVYGFSFGRSDLSAMKIVFNHIHLTTSNVVIECYYHVEPGEGDIDARNSFEENLESMVNCYGYSLNINELYLTLKCKGRIKLIKS